MIAKALALNGAAKVYIVGRREEKLREAAQFHSRYQKSRPDRQAEEPVLTWLPQYHSTARRRHQTRRHRAPSQNGET